MSNVPKMTDPNQVWVAPSWNLRNEVAVAVTDYVESVNEMLEAAIRGQVLTKGQIDRSKKHINRLVAVIRSIPGDILMSGDPPVT